MSAPVNVVWLSMVDGIDSRGPWDTGLMEALFADQLWPTGYTFEHHVTDTIPAWLDRAVVILPARHHASPAAVEELNFQMSTLKAVVLVLLGDEEGVFPRSGPQHPNMHVWLQMPRPDRDTPGRWRLFGNGWPRDTLEFLAVERPYVLSGRYQWIFSGQVTHERRRQAANALRKLGGGALWATEGFALGMPRSEHLGLLAESRVAPCPSGPHTPDTFRAYEAFEAGALPLLDATDPRSSSGYWDIAWPKQPPVPIIHDWSTVGGVILDSDSTYPSCNNAAGAWWSQMKAWLAQQFVADLEVLGFGPPITPGVTAVITSSPSAIHPSLDHLEAVMASVPDAFPVVIAFDGVRREQTDLASAYAEYVRAAIARWQGSGRVQFVCSPTHQHQVGMYRLALPLVTSPMILALEHDTPLEGHIDWRAATSTLGSGFLDVLRLHHEHEIHREHQRLMVDMVTEELAGLPVRRTRQWSQRPHLARTAYYRKILDVEFSKNARCFVEDRMHSVCQTMSWHQNRVAIYHPDGNIRRSGHLDGRAGGPKFEEAQVF